MFGEYDDKGVHGGPNGWRPPAASRLARGHTRSTASPMSLKTD